MLTVITPTGDRAVPFGECVRYVNRSTLKPDLWIVVDDGRDKGTLAALGKAEVPVFYIHPEPMEGHSLNRNLRLAAKQVPAGSDVAIMEDDDYYPADYLAETVKLLRQGAHCAGARKKHRYNLGSRCWRSYNGSHTLCTHSLAFDPAGWRHFCDRALFASDTCNLDTMLGTVWDAAAMGPRAHERTIPTHIVGWTCPGLRPGSTRGHHAQPGGRWTADPEGEILAAWIGAEDAARLLAIGGQK